MTRAGARLSELVVMRLLLESVCTERSPQSSDREGDRRLRRLGVTKRVQPHEVMDRAVETDRRRRDPCFTELVRVRLALIAQHIVLVHDDECGWQPFEVVERCLERRHEEVTARSPAGEVAAPEPRRAGS